MLVLLSYKGHIYPRLVAFQGGMDKGHTLWRWIGMEIDAYILLNEFFSIISLR
jgi:hypothetical protein